MGLTDYKVLTFDCYGTLIDWETGIYSALQPLLKRGNLDLSRDEILATFAKHESEQQANTPDMLYSELLATVHGQLAKAWEIDVTEEDHRRFGASVADWPAFPDSVESLHYLKNHYKLVILSNVDNKSFQGSAPRLKVTFDAVYTAEDIGSYKPDARNFDYMFEKLAEQGLTKSDILHTAQSLFHDHVPAKAAGLCCAWIDRRQDQDGWGATMPPPENVKTDYRFGSLADFAGAHRAALAEG